MTSIELTAPAKVNLFLRVTGKRKDSYHSIDTIFERISLADSIRISKAPRGISVHSDTFITRSPKDNIVYKAALELIRLKKLDHGVKVEIKKRIPIAAGMGGGSSDAASVLIGMNRLFALGLNKKELMRIGSRLGSDVPFFILNTAFARGTGRGEKLSAIESKACFWHFIINPGFHVATKDVYNSLDLTLTRKKGGVKIHSLLKSMDFGMVEAMLYNDLEDTVVSKKGVIGSIIKRLATLLGKKGIVSGSGPSVFCLYRTGKEASKAKNLFLKSLPLSERRGWKIFVARTW